jgi:hypothetical protein
MAYIGRQQPQHLPAPEIDMAKYPLTVAAKRSTAMREEDANAVVPASPRASGSGFLSFRYSSTIVSSQGGRTQVKAKRVALEDGKLSTESFEGELDGRAHENVVRRAQQEVLEEAAPLLRMLRWMLPMR